MELSQSYFHNGYEKEKEQYDSVTELIRRVVPIYKTFRSDTRSDTGWVYVLSSDESKASADTTAESKQSASTTAMVAYSI
jgi:hypothetical protein